MGDFLVFFPQNWGARGAFPLASNTFLSVLLNYGSKTPFLLFGYLKPESVVSKIRSLADLVRMVRGRVGIAYPTDKNTET